MASRMPTTSSQRKLIRKIATYNDSHVERVLSSLNLALFSKRSSERDILVRRIIAGVVIVTLVSYNMGFLFVKADIVYMYPKSCLGGWSNPEYAEGEPETVSGTTDFSLSNAASLSKDSAADLYCGSFEGSVPEHVIPKNLKLTILLKGLNEEELAPISGTSFASSTLEILDATSTTDFELATSTAPSTEGATTTPPDEPLFIEPTPEEVVPTEASSSETQDVQLEPFATTTESVEVSAPVEAPAEPVPEAQPAEKITVPAQSSLQLKSIIANWFIPKVFALEEATGTEELRLLQDKATSTPESSETGSTTEATSTAELLTEATSTQSDLFSVSYSFDGSTWTESGRISNDQLYQKEFDIPLTATSSWEDIGSIQIKIQTLTGVDGKTTVLLDGMFFTVEYEKEKEASSGPQFSDSDVVSQISEEGKTLYLIKETSASSIVSDATTTDTTASSSPEATTSLSLWMKDETASSWVLLASGSQLKGTPEVQYQNGVVMWHNDEGVHYYDVHGNQYLSSDEAEQTILGQNEEGAAAVAPEVAPEKIVKPLTERKITRVVKIDSKASHSCEPEFFVNIISGKATSSVTLYLVGTSTLPSELEVGSLPKGVDVRFLKNNDYIYNPANNENSVELQVENQEGSQKGSFSLPIIYTIKNERDSSVVCQFNLVNF